jgi:signal transduction histidine kinase
MSSPRDGNLTTEDDPPSTRAELVERPERAHTDDSLRMEREKSDREVGRGLGNAAGAADAVIAQARSDADDALRASRHEDEPRPNKAEAMARKSQDTAIQRERTEADDKLAGDRRERTRALASLFALERELTDQRLATERTRADVALNNRDDFLGMVAHDLRGFMGEVAFRAGMMAREVDDEHAGKRARTHGNAIQRSIGGMKRLVGDLLDVAAIEAGRLDVKVAAGDVAAVLRDALQPFQSAAQTKQIGLELQDAPASVSAMFDHDRVVQVLGNLVSNAIKFTETGGTITLGLEALPLEVKLTVVDTGPGIPADKLEAIFGRFTQVLESDRRGLGLGLYICKCVVEAQGGRIWAESTPGRGSAFSFTLPLAPDEGEPA